MKYVDEFRDGHLASTMIEAIYAEVRDDVQYRFMEFCGGHTHAIFRHGIQTLVPKNLEYIHGPGCPVCVLPSGRIDSVIELLLREPDIILCTYGDVLRVPATNKNSLQKMRAQGADVRMVYSPLDALALAMNNPSKNVVFFAIGFETTAPPTAATLITAKAKNLRNFFVHCNHVVTTAALNALLSMSGTQKLKFNGILGPSHVSTILGSDMYHSFAKSAQLPIVVAGFEPLDVIQSTLMLVRQVNANTHVVENEYSRAVQTFGNQKAQSLMAQVFELREQFDWRGLGSLPLSGYRLNADFKMFDAEQIFSMKHVEGTEVKGCKCPQVLRGELKPRDCKLFGSVCRPDNPMGACMVSSEGACAAHWHYVAKSSA